MLALWFEAFLITQIIETPIYSAVLLRQSVVSAQKLRYLRAVVLAFTASLATHPAVWYILPAWVGFHPYWRLFVVCESFAVGAEAVFLWCLGLSARRAFLWALLANGCSAGFGLLRWWWFPGS